MRSDLILLEQDETADLPAGEFSDWLAGMDSAIRGEQASDVACGDCDACCRSSYFIELKPSDRQARARIPTSLIFAAPGAPPGHQLLGYDQNGRCPMLGAAGCSIYQDRPLTCRTYDCRIFTATGIAEADRSKAEVTARARRWRFSYRDDNSRESHRLLRLGTSVLVELQRGEGASVLPRTATQLALLAVRLNRVFHDLLPLLSQRETGEQSALHQRILEAARSLVGSADL